MNEMGVPNWIFEGVGGKNGAGGEGRERKKGKGPPPLVCVRTLHESERLLPFAQGTASVLAPRTWAELTPSRAFLQRPLHLPHLRPERSLDPRLPREGSEGRRARRESRAQRSRQADFACVPPSSFPACRRLADRDSCWWSGTHSR